MAVAGVFVCLYVQKWSSFRVPKWAVYRIPGYGKTCSGRCFRTPFCAVRQWALARVRGSGSMPFSCCWRLRCRLGAFVGEPMGTWNPKLGLDWLDHPPKFGLKKQRCWLNDLNWAFWIRINAYSINWATLPMTQAQWLGDNLRKKIGHFLGYLGFGGADAPIIATFFSGASAADRPHHLQLSHHVLWEVTGSSVDAGWHTMASGAWGWKMFHHLVGSSLVDRIVVIIIDTCMHIYKYMRK